LEKEAAMTATNDRKLSEHRAAQKEAANLLAWRLSLDTPLCYFSRHDAWTIRDACEGIHIFGATGSGKTTGSGAILARSLIRAGFGGLVLCAKPEERILWERYMKEAGRSRDLVIFAPEQPWRLNFLDYELRRTGRGRGITENLVNLFSHIIEIAEGKVDAGGAEPFWGRAAKEMLRNAIDLLNISQGTLTLDAIYRLIVDAPISPEQVGDPDWQNSSFCAACIREGTAKAQGTQAQHDLEVAARYWLKNYAALGDRTRSSIVATFTSIADTLLHGIAYQLMSTDTNLVPEITYRDGVVIVLDLPIQEYQELGKLVQGIWKYIWQRSILRRSTQDYPRPVFLWADEAQNFVSRFDYLYQAVARSARACTVYLAQNVSQYQAVLGAGGEHETHALLANFQTKIFHANSGITNQFAADLIAQDWMTAFNFGSNLGERGDSRSGGGSDIVQYKVLPATFTTLRKGGQPYNYQVEGIVFQGGRIFQATRDTYLKAIFNQNREGSEGADT
jgi:hypothetical protein